MGIRKDPLSWVVVALAVSGSGSAACAQAPEGSGDYRAPGPRVARGSMEQTRPLTLAAARAPVPVDQLPPAVREHVRRVVQHPTLCTHGPAEVFHGRPALYHWLLDHPDQAVRLWRRLGARCMEITDQGNGRFGWTDGEGSEVHWDTVYQNSLVRVWYAEGSVRPAPLLPAVTVRAVVVLRHADGVDGAGAALIQHQADLYLQTDSRTAVLVTRLLGTSAPRLAEQCVAQLELFFSALVWYLDQHPEWAGTLLGALPSNPATAASPS
jgi:hypothetical protein